MSKCYGLKFRGRVSNYFNEKRCSFEHKESLTLLKRESCKCESCKATIDDLVKYEGGSNLTELIDWNRFIEPLEIEDGKTYTARASWDSEEGWGSYIDEMYFSEIK